MHNDPVIQTEKFRAANLIARRGGSGAEICGARTKTGTLCLHPPLHAGNGRCLRHAGPKAAKIHRTRQQRAFESGRISAAEWNRAEARRAANRLGDQWKKNPWLPGSTIDLGEHERDFQNALSPVDVDALPPAVQDWLRWRYRRTQIDRDSGAAWQRALTQNLPQRIADAGPCTGVVEPADSERRTAPRTWRVEESSPGGFTHRALPDQPRAPKVQRGKGYGRRGRPPRLPEGEDVLLELAELLRAAGPQVRAMFETLPRQGDQMAFLRDLHDFTSAPNDTGAQARWFRWVERSMNR